MVETVVPCAKCGKPTPINLLDAKPSSGPGADGSHEGIALAGDTGAEFDRLECEVCYGPAWLPA